MGFGFKGDTALIERRGVGVQVHPIRVPAINYRAGLEESEHEGYDVPILPPTLGLGLTGYTTSVVEVLEVLQA